MFYRLVGGSTIYLIVTRDSDLLTYIMLYLKKIALVLYYVFLPEVE